MYSLITFALILGYVQCAPFTATVTPSANNFNIGQDVMCEITITNQDNHDRLLYTRHTPFEGFMTKMFLVTLNGSLVPYGGILVKRGPVTIESNDIRVPAKGYVSLQIDLSSAYHLSHAGKYSVSLNTQVYYLDSDSKVAKQELKSTPVMFTLINNGGTPKFTFALNEAKTIIRSDIYDKVGDATAPIISKKCTKIQQQKLGAAWYLAYKKIVASPASIEADVPHYKTWFGDNAKDKKDEVTKNFKDMQAAMEKEKPVTLDCDGDHCSKGTYAYTTIGGPSMTFCYTFFEVAPPSAGTDTQFGTVVHELSHNACGTLDHQYGTANCQALATNDDARARKNADNYEYFVETLA